MEPVDGLEKLMRLMRSTATEKTQRSTRRPDTHSTIGGRGAPVVEHSIEQELRSKIRQLQQSSASGPSIEQAVIGTMLAWEFSDELYNESKFHALVRRVHQHIESESQLKAAFDRMLERLSQ